MTLTRVASQKEGRKALDMNTRGCIRADIHLELKCSRVLFVPADCCVDSLFSSWQLTAEKLMNRFNYVNQKDIRGMAFKNSCCWQFMGISFTLLLTYPYGNSSQDPLNRKLGGLQHWSETASTETNPAEKWAPQGRGVCWGPRSHWQWSPLCSACIQ